MPVLAAAIVMAAVGPIDPPTSRTASLGAASSSPAHPQSASGKSSLQLGPHGRDVATPLGTLTMHIAPPAAPPGAPSHAETAPPRQPHEAEAVTLETQPSQPSGALLSQAAELPKASAALRLQGVPAELATATEGQAAPVAPPPAAEAGEQQPAPSKLKAPPAEKPPRVAEYYWHTDEAKEGIAAIGYGHPRRPRGQFLVGFNCKIGSGKITFIMFEAGLSRSHFTKGQKVAVTLEVGNVKAALDGLIQANDAAGYPMATATLPADDALLKAMDDDIKVLRIDIDGWTAAVQLILINEVMPAFSKSCAKKAKPEASAKAPEASPAPAPQ